MMWVESSHGEVVVPVLVPPEGVAESVLDDEPAVLVAGDGSGVVGQHGQADPVEIEPGERVVEGEADRFAAETDSESRWVEKSRGKVGGPIDLVERGESQDADQFVGAVGDDLVRSGAEPMGELVSGLVETERPVRSNVTAEPPNDLTPDPEPGPDMGVSVFARPQTNLRPGEHGSLVERHNPQCDTSSRQQVRLDENDA